MIAKKIIRMTTVDSWDCFNMNLEILSKSSQATIDLGKKFSKILRGGDIIIFSGELGGGKTTFISGLANGLEIKENLSSPSFTILNQYNAGKLKLVHIDFYRLDGIDEFDNIGIDDHIYDDSAIVCIEWGEKIRQYIKKDYLNISFNYIIEGEESINKRIIRFNSSSNYWDKKLNILKKLLAREDIQNT
ncbi:MAG: tRNA (adenosine(37)-N6)-threonylcarbamoyltransferase complex ATPase subunit type 1 TsaE [Actinobacteria bacterium]|nr:tRNA (adenosine(37)-N6)-threonylcarbamoyltransferase complex ATPase subunit type 1 TsaE [Actinomycetota bacterium]